MWAMCLKEFKVGGETIVAEMPATLAGGNEDSLRFSLLLRLRNRPFDSVAMMVSRSEPHTFINWDF